MCVGEPIPELSHASIYSLEVGFDADDFDTDASLGVVKARPKPRIHKPKLVEEYLYTCLVSQVQVMGGDRSETKPPSVRRRKIPSSAQANVSQAATATRSLAENNLALATCKSPEVTMEAVAPCPPSRSGHPHNIPLFAFLPTTVGVLKTSESTRHGVHVTRSDGGVIDSTSSRINIFCVSEIRVTRLV